jgi:hypothetical protein
VARARAAAKAAGLREFTDKYNDVCWSGKRLKPDFANLDDIFPEGVMEFEGGGVLRLPPYRCVFFGKGRGVKGCWSLHPW